MTAIADTGFVVAMMNDKDSQHKSCLSTYIQERLIYLPQSTLAEISYLMQRDAGKRLVIRFFLNLPISKFRLTELTPEDISRAVELLQKYGDTRIDFVDASVAAVAERLGITRILTLDQRDFSLIRPNHCDYFELLPRNS